MLSHFLFRNLSHKFHFLLINSFLDIELKSEEIVSLPSPNSYIIWDTKTSFKLLSTECSDNSVKTIFIYNYIYNTHSLSLYGLQAMQTPCRRHQRSPVLSVLRNLLPVSITSQQPQILTHRVPPSSPWPAAVLLPSVTAFRTICSKLFSSLLATCPAHRSL